MLLFGHRFIESESFYHVADIESISNTPANSIIHIEFDEKNLDVIKHTQINQITTSVYAKDITEVIYASSLEASYIVVNTDLAKSAQSIANEYIFDAKVLVLIQEESEIEEMATLGIDGVIFSNAIIHINS